MYPDRIQGLWVKDGLAVRKNEEGLRMVRRLSAIVGVTMVLGLLVGSCRPAKPEVYKIGLINHLTGDAALYGQSMKKGAEVALDEISAGGGINGVPVEVIYEDDRFSAADARIAFLKLVETDKVPVIMGSGSSTVSLALCPLAQEREVVQISPASTAPALMDCGEYFFSLMASDTAQGPEWVTVLEHLEKKEAAVMYMNYDYGIGVKATFVAEMERKGYKVLIAQPFEVGGTDFRTEILKVKEVNPEVTFIVGSAKEAAIVFRQARESGFDTQWVTCVSGVTKEIPELAGKEAAEGIMGLRAGSMETPEYRTFARAFEEKHGELPTIWADFAYDTMMMVAKAIEKGGYTADSIKKALFEVGQTYIGPSGPKKLNEYGIVYGVYDWMIVRNGDWALYRSAQ